MNRLKMKFRISWGLSSIHSCHIDQLVDLKRKDHISPSHVLFHLSLSTANALLVCALAFLLNSFKSFGKPVAGLLWRSRGWRARRAAPAGTGTSGRDWEPSPSPHHGQLRALLPAQSLRRATAFAQQSLLPGRVQPDARHTKTHPWHSQTCPNSDWHQHTPSSAAEFSIL